MMTIKKYVNRFLRFCEYRGLVPISIERHRFNLTDFVKWLDRKKITKETLREYLLYSRGRKARTNNGLSMPKGLKPYSINSMISSLKLFTRFLWEEEGVLSEDLSGTIKSLPIDPFFPSLLTIAELEAIIDCPRQWGKHHTWIDRRRYDFFFETLACTGLRKLEALNLKVEDIDFVEKVIKVKNSKGNKSRLVPLPKDLGRRLYLWFREREAKPTDYTFESQVRRSKRIGYGTLVDELKKRATILGINKRVYMHLLRHSFITEMIRVDAPAMKVARIVGHADLKTTLRYTHLVVDDLKDTIEKHPLNLKKLSQEEVTLPTQPVYITDN